MSTEHLEDEQYMSDLGDVTQGLLTLGYTPPSWASDLRFTFLTEDQLKEASGFYRHRATLANLKSGNPPVESEDEYYDQLASENYIAYQTSQRPSPAPLPAAVPPAPTPQRNTNPSNTIPGPAAAAGRSAPKRSGGGLGGAVRGVENGLEGCGQLIGRFVKAGINGAKIAIFLGVVFVCGKCGLAYGPGLIAFFGANSGSPGQDPLVDKTVGTGLGTGSDQTPIPGQTPKITPVATPTLTADEQTRDALKKQLDGVPLSKKFPGQKIKTSLSTILGTSKGFFLLQYAPSTTQGEADPASPVVSIYNGRLYLTGHAIAVGGISLLADNKISCATGTLINQRGAVSQTTRMLTPEEIVPGSEFDSADPDHPIKMYLVMVNGRDDYGYHKIVENGLIPIRLDNPNGALTSDNARIDLRWLDSSVMSVEAFYAGFGGADIKISNIYYPMINALGKTAAISPNVGFTVRDFAGVAAAPIVYNTIVHPKAVMDRRGFFGAFRGEVPDSQSGPTTGEQPGTDNQTNGRSASKSMTL